MAVMRLTPKQEKFCQGVASGMSYKDSYLAAYNTNANRATVRIESSKLALREDIQERIKALQKPQQEAAQIQGLNARDGQIAEIRERIEICKQTGDESSLIRYYDMLNKLYGLYKESENEQQKESSVNTLDIDTLRKLSDAL